MQVKALRRAEYEEARSAWTSAAEGERASKRESEPPMLDCARLTAARAPASAGGLAQGAPRDGRRRHARGHRAGHRRAARVKVVNLYR